MNAYTFLPLIINGHEYNEGIYISSFFTTSMARIIQLIKTNLSPQELARLGGIPLSSLKPQPKQTKGLKTLKA